MSDGYHRPIQLAHYMASVRPQRDFLMTKLLRIVESFHFDIASYLLAK